MQYFAFLRAVNVGKRTMKSMQLVEMLEELNFRNVGVFLASGNAVFDAAKQRSLAKITMAIEEKIKERFGFAAECFLFTRPMLEEISSANPFQLTESQQRDFIVNVIFFATPLADPDFRKIKRLAGDYDDFRQVKGQLFWLCRGRKMTDSPAAVSLAKWMPHPNTTRKLDTLRRVLAKFPG